MGEHPRHQAPVRLQSSVPNLQRDPGNVFLRVNLLTERAALMEIAAEAEDAKSEPRRRLRGFAKEM